MDLGIYATGRDADMRALYKQGHATSKDILAVEFGHFPPAGLDYAGKNHLDREVSLKSTFQDKESGWLTKALTTVAALGYVHGKENLVGSELGKKQPDETIFMNPALLGTVGKIAVGYLAYRMAGELIADVSTNGMVHYLLNHQMLALTVLATSLRQVPLVQIFGHPLRSFADIMGHEHIHILQIHDAKRAKTGIDMDDDDFKNDIMAQQKDFPLWRRMMNRMEDVIALGSTRYLLNDVEVQARLHTAMVHGYERWGVLPRTRGEFIAACVDCGLNVDPAVRKEIDDLSPEQKETFLPSGLTNSFGRAVRGFFDINTAELNAAHRRVQDKDMKFDYWDHQMPFMYGHLLELYGDPKGLEKMDIAGADDDTWDFDAEVAKMFKPSLVPLIPLPAPRPPQPLSASGPV